MHPSVVPQASPATRPALATSLAPCAPLLRRAPSRESGERSRTGLLTDRPRQHGATIATAVAGPATERWHHLLTEATWAPPALDQQRVQAPAVLETLPKEPWRPRTWHQHDDMALRTPFGAVRVHWATGGAPLSTSHHRVSTGPAGWLLGERPVPGDRGDGKG